MFFPKCSVLFIITVLMSPQEQGTWSRCHISCLSVCISVFLSVHPLPPPGKTRRARSLENEELWEQGIGVLGDWVLGDWGVIGELGD